MVCGEDGDLGQRDVHGLGDVTKPHLFVLVALCFFIRALGSAGQGCASCCSVPARTWRAVGADGGHHEPPKHPLSCSCGGDRLQNTTLELLQLLLLIPSSASIWEPARVEAFARCQQGHGNSVRLECKGWLLDGMGQGGWKGA